MRRDKYKHNKYKYNKMRRPEKRKIGFWLLSILLVALFIALSVTLLFNLSRRVNGVLDVYFIDVGQADAAILVCDGHAMMIDGGNAEDSSLIFSMLRNTLHISKLDCMIATHPHEDHIGGLSGALNACEVDTIYTPVREYDSRSFNSMVKYADKQGTHIRIPKPGETFKLGEAKVKILAPRRDSDNLNDMSIVCRVTYGKTSLLFTGDAEQAEEHDMLDAHARLRSDVLKVGHHGSSTSSSEAFLHKVKPDYAIISVEKDNPYGHPDDDTLSRLRGVHAKIYRTDEDGTIHCRSDGRKLSFDKRWKG